MLPSDVDLVNLCAEIYQTGGSWDYLDTGPDDEIYWGLKKLDGCDVIVFRGSITAHDWVEDFRAFPVQTRIGTVHFGFYAGMERMYGEAGKMLTQPVVVTGHSLGSARADILCGLMVAANKPPVLRTVFGCPRVGLPDFAKFLKDIPGDGYRNVDAEGHDFVTDVPLQIRHTDFDFVHPKLLVDLSAIRIGNALARQSLFSLHHIEVYQAAIAAHHAKELA